MKNQEERAAIIAMHNASNRQCDIAQVLKITPNKVYRAVKLFKELNTLQYRPRSGCPASANTSRNRSITCKRIKTNPKRSMRKMVKDLKISDRSVRRIVKNQLGYYHYKFQKFHYLTE